MRSRRFGFVLSILMFILCTETADAQFTGRPNQTLFQNSVQKWRGSFKLSAQSSGAVSIQGIPVRYSYSLSATGTVDLPRYDSGLGAWVGIVKGTAALNWRLEQELGDCTLISTAEGTAGLDNDIFGQPREFLISLDLESDAWSFWTFDNSAGDFNTRTEQRCGENVFATNGSGRLTWSPLNRSMGLVFPASGFNLTGSKTIMCDCSPMPEPIPFLIEWDFAPVVHELELVLDPQGYDAWRPEALWDEETIANTLEVKATLRYADDGTPPTVPAEQFVFELVGTSKEPGVAMNVPLKSEAKTTHDLKFSPDNNPAGLNIQQEGQKAETHQGEYTTYTITISSYDWGGWTTLRGTAIMPGGQRIEGHLVNQSSVKDVLIPKRANDSKIAEAWLKDAGISGKDSDDDENAPEGDGNKGDGLTLYEEYRGFYENGQPMRGNPKKKDYFLLNLVGADAEAGVWLFTELTGLEVHKDIQRDEMADDRLINANYDQGAHSVDQHGVIMKTANIDGAIAYDSRNSPPGPPRNTEVVLIEPRDQQHGTGTFGSANTGRYRISDIDQAEAYDRAVAHELLHTVGVWHHGEGDYKVHWYFYPSSLTPDNKPYLTRPAQGDGTLFLGEPETRIRVTVEESGQDYALFLDQRYAPLLEIVPELFTGGKLLVSDVRVGKRGGQSSGADDCVMRYYFSDVYEAEGRTNEFYIFQSQTVGLNLDQSPEGTGNNAPGHQPQPRFFNASVSRGDLKQIVVNDKANPVRP